MADQKPKASVASVLIAIVLIAVGYWFWFGGGIEQQTATKVDEIYKKVAADQVEQYNITARNGTAIDRCVHAGLVSAAYLQAKDEDNYKVWKAKETADCQAAGR